MNTIIRNEDYEITPQERTVIYENPCFIDCRAALERIYHNTDGTFDAVITIEGEIVAEYEKCPSAEYAAESIMEFDVE